MTSNQTGQNYDAYALGDVNGDLAIPVSAATLPTTPMRVSIPVAVAKVALPNVDPSLGDFVAAVTTSNIDGGDKLVAFQGDFTFDSSVVTFQSTPVARAGLTANGNWALAANVLGAGTLKTLRVVFRTRCRQRPLRGRAAVRIAHDQGEEQARPEHSVDLGCGTKQLHVHRRQRAMAGAY